MRKVRIFLDSETTLEGVTHDISTQGAAFFLSLKNGSSFFCPEERSGKIPFSFIRSKLKDQVILVDLQDTDLEPVNFEITRIEPSWKKGFHIFLGGRFRGINEFLVKQIEQICPRVLRGGAPREIYVSDSLPAFRKNLLKEKAEVYRYRFTNNYRNIGLHRDLVARLAEAFEFGEKDVYYIKLLVDEILMNAFLYGALAPGKDCTELDILLSHGKLLITVKDFAGREFDDYPYHFRQEKKHEKGGLSLIEELSDDWQVTNKPGKTTEVSFFKTASGN